jgi:signal peptidase II
MQLILWTVIVIGSVILDQWTKYLAVQDLMPIGSTVVLDGLLGFRYVENTGAAFGMLKGQRWFFITLSTLAILAIFVFLIKKRKTVPPLLGIAMAMIAGGGIGNQIDRILNGFVVDFFEFLFIDFAVFNVADVFVSIGACLAVLDLLFVDRKYFLGEPQKKGAPADEPMETAPSQEGASELPTDAVAERPAEPSSQAEAPAVEVDDTPSSVTSEEPLSPATSDGEHGEETA